MNSKKLSHLQKEKREMYILNAISDPLINHMVNHHPIRVCIEMSLVCKKWRRCIESETGVLKLSEVCSLFSRSMEVFIQMVNKIDCMLEHPKYKKV